MRQAYVSRRRRVGVDCRIVDVHMYSKGSGYGPEKSVFEVSIVPLRL
jgi:hypothetical protein